MLQAFRQLLPGFFLIAGASCLLLFSDFDSRVRSALDDSTTARDRLPRVAIVQHNAQPVFDTGVEGMIVGLSEMGFDDGETMVLRKLNPYGDTNLANAIAREVVEGGYQLILTATTPSLQSVANANHRRGIPHVLALVADPVATGVGILEMDSPKRPPHLTGYGTRLPAESAIRIAHEINPSLKVVGTVWNVTEVNSEVQLADARRVCEELGIELIEVNADTTGAVLEAANSVVSRGIEALFIPGDVTVLAAVNNVIRVAQRAGIPSFSVFPSHAEEGALFGVGADYFEVGRLSGRMGGEILLGRDPAEINITNFTPEQIALNEQVRRNLRNPEVWRFPDSLLDRADIFISAEGQVLELGEQRSTAVAAGSNR